MHLEQITNKKQLLGLIIRADYHSDGISFFTPDNFSQQLAYMNHPSGYVIPAHVHTPVHRDVFYTREVLFIKSGKVRVDFYTEERDYLESRILVAGNVLLLASGGHGFEMIEPTEMIEVKQGPYAGDQDKTRFPGVDHNHIILKEDSDESDSGQ